MKKTLENKDKGYQENFLKKIANTLLIGLSIGISYLPFFILYRISYFLYLFIRYIFKYRKKVIIENLTNAFPKKSETEIKQIMGRFYLHFCDMFVETIKSYSVSTKQFYKHISFSNIEILNAQFEKGKSIIILGMHYNNWEWNNILQDKCKHQTLVIYNPIRGNKAFEDFLLKIRTRWGSIFVPVHKSRRIVFDVAKEKKPTALVLGADQASPASSNFWTIFLNQETPFFSGPQKIASRSNNPIFFHYMRKTKRGKYEVDFIPLFDKPKEVEPNEIMLTYIRKMEEIIREEPAYYLWSHRRWKHSRPENTPMTF